MNDLNVIDAPEASFLFKASPMKKVVEDFEKLLASMPQRYVKVKHDVNGGVYTRTGLIPAGTTFIGAVHTKDHINIVCGDITILTESGPIRYTGYHVLPAKAGSKRVAYTHADTMWTTVLHTTLTDIRAIEDESVEDSSQLQTRKMPDEVKEIKSCS